MEQQSSAQDAQQGQRVFEVEISDEARRRLESTVAALRRPAVYPGDVRRVEAIETHMSWVFLTEEYAYKLKKPIRTPMLDHTTELARRRACRTEIELNRRLAEDVYLRVAPLVASGDKFRVEGKGTPVDWFVKMRRLPRERMLDECIERDEVEPAEVDRVAAKLSTFYRSADPAGFDGPEYRGRISDDIASKHASLEQPRYGLDSDEVAAVVEAQRHWLDEYAGLLEARASFVVDAHGDLRPEHVCLESEPVIIDCLEFERELRLLDPISELSFLALECQRLGAKWVGTRLFDGYREQTGDDYPSPLVPFYKSYHALVRAAVAVWHVDDHVVDDTDHWRDKGSRYLQLARHLL